MSDHCSFLVEVLWAYILKHALLVFPSAQVDFVILILFVVFCYSLTVTTEEM